MAIAELNAFYYASILLLSAIAGARMEGAVLNHAQLEGADLSQANVAMSSLKEAKLGGADLSNANFNGTNLHSAHLEGVRANGVKMAAAILTDASLEGASLVRANFRDADLSGVNLNQAHLNRAYLVSCHLEDARLEDANLSGAYMLSTCLKNASLRGSILIRAYLSHADLENTNFNEANLSSATLSGVDINRMTRVNGTRFAMNQGLNREDESVLEDRGASILRTLRQSSSLEQGFILREEAFETARRLDEVKIDINYRYLDLDEAVEALHSALKRTEASFKDAQDLKSLSEQQVEKIQRVLDILYADQKRFTEEIKETQQQLHVLFNYTPSEDMEIWLDSQLVDELSTIHEQLIELDRHTHLTIELWRSFAQVEEPNSVQ